MPDDLEKDPSRYIGSEPEKVDVTAGKVGIDRNPTYEESRFLKAHKDRFTINAQDYINNKDGIKSIIDSLLAKRLIKGSILNEPKSSVYSYEKIK
ncbi:MAG: hypothetical protein KGJ93_03145 [Patescibacteria group bacterium]|nr:hypothetical protein [Patescibacteria group bacterium]